MGPLLRFRCHLPGQRLYTRQKPHEGRDQNFGRIQRAVELQNAGARAGQLRFHQRSCMGIRLLTWALQRETSPANPPYRTPTIGFFQIGSSGCASPGRCETLVHYTGSIPKVRSGRTPRSSHLTADFRAAQVLLRSPTIWIIIPPHHSARTGKSGRDVKKLPITIHSIRR